MPAPHYQILVRDPDKPGSNKFVSAEVTIQLPIIGDLSGENLIESDDHVEVNGVTFAKPFVEKPISAENHNICKRLDDEYFVLVFDSSFFRYLLSFSRWRWFTTFIQEGNELPCVHHAIWIYICD